ncbi:MAG TPA: hypothetical protein VF271_02990 [Rhodanobacteraceae bacterium]
MAKEACCDWCGDGLNCAVDSAVAREYWTTALGLCICDACIVKHSDDDLDLDSELRSFALRLRESRHGIVLAYIRECIECSRGVIVDWQVDEVEAELSRAFKLYRDGERLAAIEAASAAWSKSVHMRDLVEKRPVIARDARRQEGTRNKRGSRMPELDAWLDERLGCNLPVRNDVLWEMLPDERDDFQRAGVYRDGEKVVEYRDDAEHVITRAGFNKRVTAARKRR